MFKKFFLVGAAVAGLAVLPSLSRASDDSELILKVLIKKGIVSQQDVDEMRQEIGAQKKAEGATAEGKSLEDRVGALEKDMPAKAGLEKLTSKLKLKGRWAAGYFNSGKAGAFEQGSFEVPEAKIQFAFEPDAINKIIMRFNLNNATFNNLDYFYMDTDLAKLFKLGFPLSSRIGRFKLDFGEETFSNNPVESVLPGNSAGNVSGSDEGIQLSGKIGKKNPLYYSASVTNGVTGTGSDTTRPKAFTGKLAYNIIDPLSVGVSYYNSSTMKTSSAEFSVGGLVTRPTGATSWRREAWEVDLRYDYKKGKTLNPPAYSDSKGILRMAFGGFSDEAVGAAERDGTFGFVEGTYNLNKKVYLASRASFVDLENDATATFNSVTAGTYWRYSLGLGYRLTSNTILKVGYDLNKETGPGVNETDNNLFSALVASQF